MYIANKHFLTIIFIVVASILSCTQLSAQSILDTLALRKQLQKGDSLKKLKKYDPAILSYKEALVGYQKTQLWELVATCENKIAELYRRKKEYATFLTYAKQAYQTSTTKLKKNSVEYAKALDHLGRIAASQKNYDKALTYYKESLEKCKSLEVEKTDTRFYIISSNRLVNLYIKMSQYDKAELYARESLVVSLKHNGKEHYTTSRCFDKLGLILYYQYRYAESLENYQKAIKGYQQEPHKTKAKIGACYNIVALIYDELFQINKALEYYKRALTLFKELYGKKHLIVGQLLMNISSTQANSGKYSDAISQLEEAIEIFTLQKGSATKHLGDAHNNIGYTHFLFGDHKKSLEHYQKALFFWKEYYGEEKNPDLALVYGNLGDANYHLGNYEKAFVFNKKGIDLYQELFGKNNPQVADLYNYRGKIYKAKDAYALAIEQFQKALTTNSLKGSTDYYKDTHTALLSFLEIARTYVVQYSKNTKIEFLEKSMLAYRKAIAMIPLLRSDLDRKDQIAFSKNVKEVYTESIEVLVQLNQLGSKEGLLDEAFDYAAKSKSFALKKSIRASAVTNVAGVPSTIIKLQKTIASQTTRIQSELLEEEVDQKQKDTIKIAFLREELFQLNQRKDSLIRVISEQYPEYYRYQYEWKPIRISEIQSHLKSKEGILEYVLNDTITYAFFVTKEEVQVKRITTPDLSLHINQFRDAIIQKNTLEYKRLAYELYQALLGSLENLDQTQLLTIIPDGALWNLPFDLLHTTPSNTNHPKNFPYLLIDKAIHYSSAASLVFTESNKDEIVATNQCLAFSYAQNDKIQEVVEKGTSLKTLRNSKVDLPGTRAEIKAISSIVDGNYYYIEGANEANFKKQAKEYAILHLALHGEVNHENPELSKLYFSPKKDSLEDNMLHNHELFALSIPAKLAVLSACNTGSGRINKGEGIMSLGSAFRYAGTKSLLLTNWEIADHTTPQLMQNFYENMQQGMDKATALQKAKLKYLSSAEDKLTHPVYWAGFYLLGDNTPIVPDRNYLIEYWVLILIIFTCIALFFHSKKYLKKKQL